MARLRSPDVLAVLTPDGIPVELTDPSHPAWSTPTAADRWRSVHGLRPAGPLPWTYRPPATGARLRHAQAIGDWSTAHGLNPRLASEMTGWTAAPTSMERAAARSGSDYVQPRTDTR